MASLRPENLARGQFLQRRFDEWERNAEAAKGTVRGIERQIAEIERGVEHAARYIMEHGQSDPIAVRLAAHARLAQEELPALQAKHRRALEQVAMFGLQQATA